MATVAVCVGIRGCWSGDLSGRRIFEWIGKPAASLAFLALGVYTAGATDRLPVSCPRLRR